MKERKSYAGKLNGVSGVWCDRCPKGLELVKENTWYTPDPGKVFIKDGEFFDSITLKDGESIEDYIEVADQRKENTPKDQN